MQTSRPIDRAALFILCDNQQKSDITMSPAMDTTNSSWLNLKTSIFSCTADNFGKLRSFNEILFSDFAVSHEWFFKDDKTSEWISGNSNDLKTIIDLRTGRATEEEKILLKKTLQCYTVSASFECKKKHHERLISYPPLLQLDFDKLDNIEQIKREIFKLPCVAYVGRSVSGKGLFAILLIAEPDKLHEYAEHCFIVFEHWGLKPDVSKGRNYTDLRFVSYDANAFYRAFPTPLRIKRFYTKKRETRPVTGVLSNDKLIGWAVKQIQSAQTGTRFDTVRKVAYCLGGYGRGLDEIKSAIYNSSQYSGVENKYLTHADEAFTAGQEKPLA